MELQPSSSTMQSSTAPRGEAHGHKVSDLTDAEVFSNQTCVCGEVVTVDPGHPRVLLKGLRRETFYSFLLTVSTDGGNRSGSVLTFRTLSTGPSPHPAVQ